jgi:apolipoprotein N-acyltransferase
MHHDQRIKQSPPAKPHAGGRHTCEEVVPAALKGSFVTLLSPPQYYAIFGMMYTIALFAVLGHYPSLQRGCLWLDFGWGFSVYTDTYNFLA